MNSALVGPLTADTSYLQEIENSESNDVILTHSLNSTNTRRIKLQYVQSVIRDARSYISCPDSRSCLINTGKQVKPCVISTVLIILWSLLGGGVFYLAEYHREKTLIKQHIDIERQYQELYANNTGVMDMEEIIDQRESFRARNIPSDIDNNRWGFWRSMFFSFTLCSTIGYGYTYPVTRVGKLWAMFYGIVGLVIFAMSFGKIGQFLLKVTHPKIESLLHWIQQKLSHIFCECDRIKDEVYLMILRTTIILFLMTLVCFVGAIMFRVHQGWTIWNGFYFMFISVSTIGFGDLSPENTVGEAPIPIMIVIFIGLALFAAGVGQMQIDFEKNAEEIGRRITRSISSPNLFPIASKFDLTADNIDGNHDYNPASLSLRPSQVELVEYTHGVGIEMHNTDDEKEEDTNDQL